MAWLANWDKRIKITADKDVVDANLSHFPLTIRLGTAVGIGDVDVSCVFDELTSNDNRKKIAVTKTDGETQLYVEIEQWDDANEKAVHPLSWLIRKFSPVPEWTEEKINELL